MIIKLPISHLTDKIQMAFEQNQAFLVYKKPNETIVNAQFLWDDEIISIVDFKESGFIFAPFDDEKPAILFPLAKSEQFQCDFLMDNLMEENKEIDLKNKVSDKEAHIKLVEKAIETIKLNEFEKVVISRKEVIEIADFDFVNTYKSLLKKYPTAMVYGWFHPKVGLWMGATPELLCKVKNNHFATVALAGTQLIADNEMISWGDKEIYEQQLVKDFIVDELNTAIKNIKISNPYSVKAGHLWHIKTDIEGEIAAESSLEKIIQKLHPTPAVCGLPRKSAKEFILQNEAYNREFYTGYLGEININKSTDLYVNLRCMKIEEKNISIYVGGGITQDSIPEKEWEETVSKAKTMKNVLL